MGKFLITRFHCCTITWFSIFTLFFTGKNSIFITDRAYLKDNDVKVTSTLMIIIELVKLHPRLISCVSVWTVTLNFQIGTRGCCTIVWKFFNAAAAAGTRSSLCFYSTKWCQRNLDLHRRRRHCQLWSLSFFKRLKESFRLRPRRPI